MTVKEPKKRPIVNVVGDGDSKRFTRWQAPRSDDDDKERAKYANSIGIVGSIYVPKDTEVPDEVVVRFIKE